MRISRDNPASLGPLPVLCLAAVCAVLCPEPARGQSEPETAIEQLDSDVGQIEPILNQSLQPVTSDGTVLPASSTARTDKNVVAQTADPKDATVTPDGTTLPAASQTGIESDADLGEQWVMKKNEPPPKAFTVFGDVSVFHTSNVALGHDNEIADWFLVATVGASYSRPFANIWNLNIFVSETLFRYDRFSEFDFENLSGGVGVSIRAHPLWDTTWSLQYSFSVLNGRSSVGQLFNGHSFSLTGNKTVRLSSADSLTFGLGGAFNIADPSSLQRVDLSANVTYSVALTRKLSIGATLHEGFLSYTEGSRHDFVHSLAVSGRYVVNKWFSLSASAAGTYNQSNEPAFEYKVLNLGFGLSGNIQF